jgi:hypothetical protein
MKWFITANMLKVYNYYYTGIKEINIINQYINKINKYMKKNKIRENADVARYEITFDEDDNQGVQSISLVKDPAIMVMGKTFANHNIFQFNKAYHFKIQPEKQIIAGPFMIPNIDILRIDKNGNPFYVYFSEETITRMCLKFNKENSSKDINVDHEDIMVPGFIQANWQIEDNKYDKSKFYGFEDLPLRTWFGEIKIEDKKFWEKEVKLEGRFGFSIEGYMDGGPDELMSAVTNDKEIIDMINSLTLNEIFKFINLDDIPLHPHCQCEADEYLWVCQPGACDECLAAQSEYNKYVATNDFDTALSIFLKHTGKDFRLQAKNKK